MASVVGERNMCVEHFDGGKNEVLEENSPNSTLFTTNSNRCTDTLSPDGVSTLTWWGSLRASVTPRAMPAVA